MLLSVCLINAAQIELLIRALDDGQGIHCGLNKGAQHQQPPQHSLEAMVVAWVVICSCDDECTPGGMFTHDLH